MQLVLIKLLVAIMLFGAGASLCYLCARKLTAWGKDKKQARNAAIMWFFCSLAGSMFGALIAILAV